MRVIINACASPLIATQMVWSRVVNVRGGSGHNIPLDLHMENLNRVLKDYVSKQRRKDNHPVWKESGRNNGTVSRVRC